MIARRTFSLLIALGISASLSFGGELRRPERVLAQDTDTLEATVTRVIDGSSLDVRVDGNRTAVGYLGVETPDANEPCGQEALARNQELASPAVRLEPDPTYEVDERGRRLYYAYTLDGRSIDETLVGEGLAFAARADASRGADLAELQMLAAMEGRGCLWNDDDVG